MCHTRVVLGAVRRTIRGEACCWLSAFEGGEPHHSTHRLQAVCGLRLSAAGTLFFNCLGSIFPGTLSPTAHWLSADCDSSCVVCCWLSSYKGGLPHHFNHRLQAVCGSRLSAAGALLANFADGQPRVPMQLFLLSGGEPHQSPIARSCGSYVCVAGGEPHQVHNDAPQKDVLRGPAVPATWASTGTGGDHPGKISGEYSSLDSRKNPLSMSIGTPRTILSELKEQAT